MKFLKGISLGIGLEIHTVSQKLVMGFQEGLPGGRCVTREVRGTDSTWCTQGMAG